MNENKSAHKSENSINSQNNKKRYSDADYENSHLTDNETDYNYDFARLTAHGIAGRKSDDENTERQVNYILHGRYKTNDEMLEIFKFIFIYGIGILFGCAFGRLFNVGFIGYCIFSALGIFAVGFVKYNGIEGYTPAQSVKKSLILILIAVIIAVVAYLINLFIN